MSDRPARRLDLLPLGAVDPLLLERLAPMLEQRLRCAARLVAALPLRPEWRDPLTGRYRSTAIVTDLVDAQGSGAHPAREWTLALTEAELDAADAPSVFGEAAVGGGCAVVSLAPLREGEGARAEVFAARLLTEAVHELGHAAGAEHCPDPECVMFASRSIAETDRKGSRFCERCRIRALPAAIREA